ncbi:MAG TPA: NUDIX domain-containing protein [Nevskiaceae bacterium]|nr:NUDIX domain-containing protein [Nevskiaceae bacterium]
MSHFKFCPRCATPLQLANHGGAQRLACSKEGCDFVHWENPTPVVAAIVEHEGAIILARNRAWPMKFYGLITGFLEKEDPSPDEAARREVKEELGLDADRSSFVGHYPFPRMNQIIIAYHVPAKGEIVLSEELVEYKRIEPEKARYWPGGTGFALRDWLRSRGLDPQPMELPTKPM